MAGGGDGWTTFINPFENAMWLCVALTYILVASLLAMTYHFGQYLIEDHQFDLRLSSLVSVHSLFMQGAPYEPKKMSSRIVFLCAFITAVVLYASYSACLTSFLAVKRDKYPFWDDESLMSHNSYKMMSMAGTMVNDIYKVSLN